MSYQEEPFDPWAYYTGEGNYGDLNLPTLDPAMLQVMQNMVPQTQPGSDKTLTAANMSSLLNSYGNLLFDPMMMGMGGANAFSPDAFASTVSQTPVDAPLFSAFTGYLRDETTFEGQVASELIAGGSASGAVQKMRQFIENNPDDPEALRMIQLLPPVPYDAMADPEAPPQVDWSEAQNNARRVEEQFYVMPAAQRSLLPQLLDPNAAVGAEVQTEDGALSLGVDEMGNPVIMQTTVTPSEQAQHFTDQGLSLPTDTYQTEDFLPQSWQAEQQNYANVIEPAYQQALQSYNDTWQQGVEPLGAEQLAGQPAQPYQYEGETDPDQQAAMMAIAKLLHDPNQIVSIAGRGTEAAGNAGNAIVGLNEEIYGGTADALSELLGPFSGAWQTAGGGGGFPDLGVGDWFEGAEGGLNAQQWLDQRNQEEALRQVQQILQAQQMGGGQPSSNAQGDGGGGIVNSIWDALTGGSSVGSTVGGGEAWERLTGEQAAPSGRMQVDYGSSPATYQELLAEQAASAGVAPLNSWERLIGRGNEPQSGNPVTEALELFISGAQPGQQQAAAPSGAPEQMTMAMLQAILGQQPDPNDLPGAQPANQPGGPAYMSQVETGERYDPLSSAQTGEPARRSGAPEGRPTQTRAGQGGHQLLLRGQSQQGVRDRARDTKRAAWSADKAERDRLFGADFGEAWAQARHLRNQGVTPYQQEMAMRRMVLSAMGMPTGGLPGV